MTENCGESVLKAKARSRSIRVAVIGARGFIGSAIAKHLRSVGYDVVDVERSATDWIGRRASSTLLSELIEIANAGDAAHMAPLLQAIDDCEWLVNAAGAADPAARALGPRLLGPNVVLPLTLQRAAAEMKIRRFVHLSSAAVQGSQTPLDEGNLTCPVTPYAQSKALAEHALTSSPWASRVGTVLYRPTSVHGRNREATARFASLLGSPLVPRVGEGRQQLPVTSSKSVARATLHILKSDSIKDGVVLHPWEGVTQEMLLAATRGGRRIVLPTKAVNMVRQSTDGLSLTQSSAFRRVELLLCGQEVDATRLISDGFVLASTEEILGAFR